LKDGACASYRGLVVAEPSKAPAAGTR